MAILSTPKGLILSSIIGQVIVLLSIPIMTKIVGVEKFGTYTEFLSFTVVAQLLSSLRIETIFLSKERGKMSDNDILSSLSFLSLVLTLFLSLISYAYFKNYTFFILFFISSYIGNLASIYTFYSLAKNEVIKLTMYRILRPILLFVLQFLFIYGIHVNNPLEIGYTVSIVISAFISFKIYGLFSLMSYKKIFIMLSEGRKYMLFSFPSDALNSIGSQLPILLFARYFGKDIAVYYYTVNKTIIAPYALVTESLSKINMRIFKKDSLKEFLVKLSDLQSIQVSLFLSSYTVLLLFSDQLALFFLGESSSEFTLIVCAALPLSFAIFIGVPLLALLSVSSRQQVDLLFQIVLFVARLIGVGLGFYFRNFLVSLLGYFLLSSVVYIFFAYKSGQEVGYDAKIRLYIAFSIMMALVALKFFVFDASLVLKVLIMIVSISISVYSIIKFFSLEATNN